MAKFSYIKVIYNFYTTYTEKTKTTKRKEILKTENPSMRLNLLFLESSKLRSVQLLKLLVK